MKSLMKRNYKIPGVFEQLDNETTLTVEDEASFEKMDDSIGSQEALIKIFSRQFPRKSKMNDTEKTEDSIDPKSKSRNVSLEDLLIIKKARSNSKESKGTGISISLLNRSIASKKQTLNLEYISDDETHRSKQ